MNIKNTYLKDSIAHIKCFSSKIYFLIFKILIYLIYLFSNKEDAKYFDIDITGNMVEHF